jgi:hypothetical protein
MRLALFTATIATTAFAAACFAQGAPSARPMRGDTNGDRAMTKAETVALAETRFARLDADADGKVTAAEMKAARKTMRERIMARRAAAGRGGITKLGVNQDQLVAKAEWQARSAARFDRLDLNRDGSLDQAERAAMAERRQQRRSTRGSGTPAGF